MRKKELALEVIERLKKEYPDMMKRGSCLSVSGWQRSVPMRELISLWENYTRNTRM